MDRLWQGTRHDVSLGLAVHVRRRGDRAMGAPAWLFRERPGQVMGVRGDVRRSTADAVGVPVAGAPVLPTKGLECLLGCNRPSEKSSNPSSA